MVKTKNHKNISLGPLCKKIPTDSEVVSPPVAALSPLCQNMNLCYILLTELKFSQYRHSIDVYVLWEEFYTLTQTHHIFEMLCCPLY